MIGELLRMKKFPVLTTLVGQRIVWRESLSGRSYLDVTKEPVRGTPWVPGDV